MLRRLAPLFLSLSVVAGLGALACDGTKNFTFDAGSTAPAVDAGPCDVYTQTNCPSDLKCTIQPDGSPVCGAKGDGTAYADCLPDGGADDAACSAGTACVTLSFTGFVSGNKCYPFCNPDAGNTCPGGGTCLSLSNIPEGFCDTQLPTP